MGLVRRYLAVLYPEGLIMVLDPAQITYLFDMATAGFLGASGGLTHLLVTGKRPTFGALLSCIVVSGFAGIMMDRLMAVSDFPLYLQEVAIGGAGFGGPNTLYLIHRKIMKATLGVSDTDLDRAREDAREDREDDSLKY